MEKLIPWSVLETELEQHYPKGKRGRPPYPLRVMLRVHCLQLFYNLSDPAMEDALVEIDSMRRFANLSLAGNLPDETTILNFRRFLEKNDLSKVILQTINSHLEAQGMLLREGTIMDATIINAPSSTKNKDKARDPEMHQTKKGNEWHFGMKMHIGVDAVTGVIHSLETTAANVHDLTPSEKLLHGGEKHIFADAGYQGMEKRPEHEGRSASLEIAMRPGKRSQLSKGSPEEKAERTKASIRAKVEHPFRLIKCVFGYVKVRYRGLTKNHSRLTFLAALANLITMKKALLA